jgi:glycosyltransferase involved in cell wall biosynthesis
MTDEMSEHGFFDRWRWGERLFARVERWIDGAPAEIVTSTEPLLARLTTRRSDGAAHVTLLGDGVDAESFRPDPDVRRRQRERLGYRDGDFVVGYLGLLTPYQGVDLLLEVAPRVVAEVPETRFLVMGFPNEHSYRQRAERTGLGDRVRFTGRIRYEEAAAYLTAADLAVSPKLTAAEGNGKLLDYMAVGLPTVAFDTAINRAILGEHGAYARLGDGEDLAARLVELLRDERRRRALGEALRRRAVEQFSWQTRARQLERVYGRLLPKPADSVEPARALL